MAVRARERGKTVVLPLFRSGVEAEVERTVLSFLQLAAAATQTPIPRKEE